MKRSSGTADPWPDTYSAARFCSLPTVCSLLLCAVTHAWRCLSTEPGLRFNEPGPPRWAQQSLLQAPGWRKFNASLFIPCLCLFPCCRRRIVCVFLTVLDLFGPEPRRLAVHGRRHKCWVTRPADGRRHGPIICLCPLVSQPRFHSLSPISPTSVSLGLSLLSVFFYLSLVCSSSCVLPPSIHLSLT